MVGLGADRSSGYALRVDGSGRRLVSPSTKHGTKPQISAFFALPSAPSSTPPPPLVTEGLSCRPRLMPPNASPALSCSPPLTIFISPYGGWLSSPPFSDTYFSVLRGG